MSSAGVLFNHHPQRLQRLKRQALITTDIIDLVIVGQSQQIMRIGRISLDRVKVDVALCRRATVRVVFVLVVRKRLHNQRTLREFRVRIEPFDLTKGDGRVIRCAALKLQFTS